MHTFETLLLSVILLVIPLYPKFPLLGVSGSFVSIRLEDFVIAAVFGIFLIGSLKRRFSDFFHPIPRAILLYLTIGLVSAFTGIFLTKTASLNLGILHTVRRFEYLALFFVGFSAIKHIQNLHFITRVILVVSLLVALFGLGQQYLGFPVISTTNSEFSKGLALQLGPGARINSTFAGHYDLAAFTVFPLLFLIALLPVSRHRIALLGMCAPIYWTMLLSASRITFASFFASAGLLILAMRKPLWLLPLGVLAVSGFLASPQLRGRYLELITNHLRITYVQPVSAQEPATDSGSREVRDMPDALKPPEVAEDRSFNIRLKAEWPKAVRAITKNPVVGTGYSSVGLAVDNDYLRIAAETGLLGLAAFLLIFIRFFKTTLPFIITYKPSLQSAYVLAVTASVASLLMGALFIDIFSASKIAIFTWAMVGSAEKAKQLKI